MNYRLTIGSMLRLLALAALSFAASACGGEADSREVPAAPAREQARSGKASVMPTRIRISVDGTVLTAVLNDSKAAQEFAAVLPFDLRPEDYNRTEKISDLPRKLTREGAPAGFDPSAGDIAVYAPWGNLALFYRDFGYSEGLVPARPHRRERRGAQATRSGQSQDRAADGVGALVDRRVPLFAALAARPL